MAAACGTPLAPVRPPDVAEPPAQLDETCQKRTWYFDADGDGYGDPTRSKQACGKPQGWSQRGSDCDDDDRGTFPGGIEVCDGVDRDCDGVVDDNALDALDWYYDDDGDGWGDEPSGVRACHPPVGQVARSGDCDDKDAAYHPLADDPPCDGFDQDCSGGPDYPAAENHGHGYITLQQALQAGPDPDVTICSTGPHPVAHVQEGGSLSLVAAQDVRPVLEVASGRMLDIQGATSVNLERLELRGAVTDGDGGALRIQAQTVVLSSIKLHDNRATGRGGAAFLGATGTGEGPSVRVLDLSLERNQSGDDGGGIFVQAPDGEVWLHGTGSTNRAGGRGGSIAVSGAATIWTGLRTLDDRADGDGGSFAAWGHDLDVRGDLDATAATSGGRGGAISLAASGALTWDPGTRHLYGSEAATDGGCVALQGRSVAVTSRMYLSSCVAGRDGGAIWLAAGDEGVELVMEGTGHRAGRRGGGAYVQADDGPVEITCRWLNHNHAAVGGALYVSAAAPGAVRSSLDVRTDALYENHALRGAAAWIGDLAPAGRAVAIEAPNVFANTGSPAIDVDQATGGSVTLKELLDNPRGGLRVPEAVSVTLEGGSVEGNGPFDVEHGGVAHTAPAGTLRCTARDGCEAL